MTKTSRIWVDSKDQAPNSCVMSYLLPASPPMPIPANPSPVRPDPPAAPPSLQVDPRVCSECTAGHPLRAGGGLFWGALQSQPRGVLTIGNGFLQYSMKFWRASEVLGQCQVSSSADLQISGNSQ
eukprot:226475-Pelagomonas_calceolata.AAC.1